MIDRRGLVAWYPLDNGSSRDDSGNRFNGTATAVTPVGGNIPNKLGLSFNGSTSQIVLPNLSAMSGTTPRTVSAFLVRNGTSIGCIYSSGVGSADASFSIYVNVNGIGDVYVLFSNDDYFTAIGLVPSGPLCHVAAVYDGGTASTSTVHIYINGIARALTKAGSASSPNTTNSNFGIGYDAATAGRVFSGTIYDLRCYNRALSAAEIFGLSNEPYQPQIDIETLALMHGTYAAGSFNPAWAIGSNSIIGAGARAL